MNLWGWLAGSEPPSPPPPPERKEPLIVNTTKQPGDVVGSINSLAFPQPLLYAALGGYASNTGVPVTPFTSLQSAAVYGCCKCISEDIASLPLQVRRRAANGGWMVDRQHPLALLFKKPNRWMSAWQFWSYALFAICLRGNSYIVICRDGAGRPSELVPVSPDRVTVKLSAVDGRPWYLVNARQIGIGVWIPPEDMLHAKNMSVDGYLGLSPIACAQDTIGLSLAAQQHGAVLFRQGAQVAGVIKHPGKLSDEATKNLAESWRDSHSGVQNATKTAILEEGMTFEKIGITNEDAQFLQTRQFQVLDICRLYRVPPHKIADYGRATFNNIEQQQQMYVDDCLGPQTDQFEGLMDDQLLFDDERDTYETHFDYTGLLRGDTIRRYQGYAIGLTNGFLNPNEVRAAEGLNPVPGGEEFRRPLNTGDSTGSTGGDVPSGTNIPEPRLGGEDSGDSEGGE
jgi:HK97 family phage portal protein